MPQSCKRDSKEIRLTLSIFLNFSISIIEIIGGLVSGSLSLISDAVHNLSDTFSLTVSFIALRLAKKKHTETKTFGYRRAETLAALLNSTILLTVSIFILNEAVSRFLNPVPINPYIMGSMASFALIANTISVILLKKDANANLNIKSAYLNMFSDMLLSATVVLGALAIYYLKIIWIDSLLTLLIGIFILKAGYGVMKQALHILMQYVPKGISVKDIQHDIEQISGVKNIHDIHVWGVTENDIHSEAHIEVSQDIKISESCVLKSQIDKLLLEKYSINHCTLQFEYGLSDNAPLITP